MPRFTISKHTLQNGKFHYDFMLEVEGAEKLKTWRLENVDFSKPQSALQNFDHRRIYLDYEGDISGDRGVVAIWDTGIYNAERWDRDYLVIKLSAKKLDNRIALSLRSNSAGENAEWEVVAI